MIPLGVEPIAAAVDDDARYGIRHGPRRTKPTAQRALAGSAATAPKRCAWTRAALRRRERSSASISSPEGDGVDRRRAATPRRSRSNARHGRLYVADGNSDSISVIDTRVNARVFSIPVSPFRERLTGLAPDGARPRAGWHARSTSRSAAPMRSRCTMCTHRRARQGDSAGSFQPLVSVEPRRQRGRKVPRGRLAARRRLR